MKDFFLADAAKHRGRNIRSHFLVAQKQLRDRNDGNAKYLSLTLLRPYAAASMAACGTTPRAGLPSLSRTTLSTCALASMSSMANFS